MRWLAVIFVCLGLTGCATSMTTEERRALDVTLSILDIGVGIVSLVTGNPAGLANVAGALGIASGTAGLAVHAAEQSRMAPADTSEPFCFCPYQEPL